MKTIKTLFLLLFPLSLLAQTAEPQVSFARDPKPLAYYVEQAELWWKAIEQDDTSEENWYNYFRACRNAHGTADWHSDFLKESPYLKMGEDIIELIAKKIPNTFTYYYVSYLKNGIGTDNSSDILKAYQMNPDFEGIHSSVISYAESSFDKDLRKKVNKEWYQTNYVSYQLLNYAYNVLMSVDDNAILFTQHDNDTYPIWLLQDAKNIKPDVMVINIDFLLINSYRESIFKALNVPALELGPIDSDDYHINWDKVVSHIITHYKGEKPIHVGMTLFNHLYEDFEDNLFVCGLTLQYSSTPLELGKLNRYLYEDVFLLDYIRHNYTVDPNQLNINYQNINYVSILKRVYNQYQEEGKTAEAEQAKNLAIYILLSK